MFKIFYWFIVNEAFLNIVSKYHFHYLIFLGSGTLFEKFRLMFSSICQVQNNSMAKGKAWHAWFKMLFSPSTPRTFKFDPKPGQWTSKYHRVVSLIFHSFYDIKIWPSITGDVLVLLRSSVVFLKLRLAHNIKDFSLGQTQNPKSVESYS